MKCNLARGSAAAVAILALTGAPPVRSQTTTDRPASTPESSPPPVPDSSAAQPVPGRSPADPGVPAVTPDATGTPPATGGQARAPAQTGRPQWYAGQPGELRGSRLVGLTVRNDAGEAIGDINEIVIGRDGRVAAVVIGVGGFLGLGERDVAVTFSSLRLSNDSNNNPVVVLALDRGSLNGAPEWKWSNADRSGVTGSGTGATVGPRGTAATGNAVAPEAGAAGGTPGATPPR